jgi:hypothetical protein
LRAMMARPISTTPRSSWPSGPRLQALKPTHETVLTALFLFALFTHSVGSVLAFTCALGSAILAEAPAALECKLLCQWPIAGRSNTPWSR